MTGVDFIQGTAEDVMVSDDIFIPGTKQTPEISCKNKSGEIIFKGNFISSNPSELLEPIQKWLYTFIKEKRASMVSLVFHLTYLNGNSGKSLCKLFQQAEDYQDRGVNFNIQMYYEDDDVDMQEWCKEMKDSYHLPFSFSKVN
ncbi:MAG: SiaC family regulatory phosphoprotein [Tenuifilaceae bacterium]